MGIKILIDELTNHYTSEKIVTSENYLQKNKTKGLEEKKK